MLTRAYFYCFGPEQTEICLPIPMHAHSGRTRRCGQKTALQEEHEYEYERVWGAQSAKKWENAGKSGRDPVAGRGGGDGRNKTLNSLSGSHSKRTFEFTANKQIMCIFCALLTTICFHLKFHSLPGTRRHPDAAVRSYFVRKLTASFSEFFFRALIC